MILLFLLRPSANQYSIILLWVYWPSFLHLITSYSHTLIFPHCSFLTPCWGHVPRLIIVLMPLRQLGELLPYMVGDPFYIEPLSNHTTTILSLNYGARNWFYHLYTSCIQANLFKSGPVQLLPWLYLE